MRNSPSARSVEMRELSPMSSPSIATDISLKVAEGRLLDVGRGLARLDPADISRLGISIGSLVQIGGKKATAVKVLPAFRDARGKQLIQIDGITRSNAGVVIGERVRSEERRVG